MTYLPKNVCLIIIHTNTTLILDMPCCHHHQQQSRENTKICMFIHYIYVDILLPLTKAIPITFERVTIYYRTLQRWIGHDETRCHNFNALPDVLPYIFSLFNMVGLQGNVLPYVWTCYYTLPNSTNLDRPWCNTLP